MTAPNAIQEAQRIINEAYAELCQRIKTGKLRNSSRNGSMVVYRAKEMYPQLFADWQKGQPPTVTELAKAFYRVLQDTEFARQLDWEKLPAALAPRNPGEPAKAHDQRAVEDLSMKLAEAHKADEKIRKQEAAKKICLALIDSFCPVDKRGNIRFSLRDKHQKDWRERLAKASNFMALEENIRSEMRKIYEELERPVYSGGYGQ